MNLPEILICNDGGRSFVFVLEKIVDRWVHYTTIKYHQGHVNITRGSEIEEEHWVGEEDVPLKENVDYVTLP